MLRFVMWTCAVLAVAYFIGFTARGTARIFRDEPGWGWLRDYWSAVVVSTVLGAIALTIWLMTAVQATH